MVEPCKAERSSCAIPARLASVAASARAAARSGAPAGRPRGARLRHEGSHTGSPDDAMRAMVERHWAGRQWQAMFIVTLTYVQPLETIDALMTRHVAWLRRHYRSGLFLPSGGEAPARR